ncbi:MAG: zf-HC2 domain-containing protein, partial [Anaerolineae bacterium]|nr:zf-HC2 domain-containing protein [Anaerolineae bacterium]
MQHHHITHLISRYLEGRLSPAQRAQVVNHVRVCDSCRAELARQERAALDLAREFPTLGYVSPYQTQSGQLATVFAGVMQDVRAQRWQDRLPLQLWLPGVTFAAVMLLVIAVVLPVIGSASVRVEAAPLQNLPVSTASPTRGVIETNEAHLAPDTGEIEPQATVAFVNSAVNNAVNNAVGEAGATPAPVPGG